ncbi:hypothetical protein E1B28_000683 [Marasmius oreades]|uniref:Uncharacterized protein n=1 Tax=Marasmius oreades TaxID=181124 RepID=A0A9P8AEV7_9AGAR|nr:uncharacterized protein E1B28_000683 [Marasmius oreades]KAG7098775.1 hypothetical protein E1B28_000683 [Marasmius oreades]
MATIDTVSFNEPHPPRENAIEAFQNVLGDIKQAIIDSRRDWDKHEPRMWNRAQKLTDQQLVDFKLEKDLVLVRSGPTTYGTIILGKIRIPAVNDAEDVKFHSILTDEGNRNEDGQPTTWCAIQRNDYPLEFFNE